MPKVTQERLESKRQAILHAAVACFARDGFHKTTMSDIASMAGVSDGLAYRYFSSKEEIIEEAVRMAAGQSAPGIVEAVDADDVGSTLDLLFLSSFERFRLPGRDSTLQIRFRAWAEALANEEVRAEMVRRWEHHAGVGERLLATAQAEGLIPDDLDVGAVARVMLAMHDGLDIQWLLDPGLDVDECRKVVMAMLHGRFWSAKVDGAAGRERSPGDGR